MNQVQLFTVRSSFFLVMHPAFAPPAVFLGWRGLYFFPQGAKVILNTVDNILYTLLYFFAAFLFKYHYVATLMLDEITKFALKRTKNEM